MSPPEISLGRFAEFAGAIKGLSALGLTEGELQRFLLPESGGNIRICYAPFDWINTDAQVVIVGITPGHDSMVSAFRAAASALREGVSFDEACKRGKRAGSFSNMRSTIAEMLDEVGLPAALGIRRSDELFGSRYDLLHPTSCVRYPVFVWSRKKACWTNYTGHNPKLLSWWTSVRYIECVLADELRRIPAALIVPCGEAVTSALQHLAAGKMIDPARCLFGFPHASRANGHRNKFFNERRDQLRRMVAEWGLRRRFVPTSARFADS
jgi:hypothetical protein